MDSVRAVNNETPSATYGEAFTHADKSIRWDELPMTHVLFFDLDGTLSDTHELARATWLEVLRPHGTRV